jgi:AmmeMemoRadiSam system protein B
VAGSWYPGDPAALRDLLLAYLDQVEPAPLPGPVSALVAPHAGYAYSGPVAAHAYAQVRGSPFRRVILLGPLHRPIWGGQMGPFMVSTAQAYRTPLGEIPVDGQFVAALADRLELVPVHSDEEHSLEIQLPFLQVALAGPFSIVPVMLGEHVAEPGAERRLATLVRVLADLLSGSPQDGADLLVASTDLSHLDNYAEVVRIDRTLARLVEAFDVDALQAALRSGAAQACGASGLVVSMAVARQLGARGARVLAYASSGDVTGHRSPGTYTVGYLAAAAYR